MWAVFPAKSPFTMPKLLSEYEKQAIKMRLIPASSVPAALDEDALALARQLSAIHGTIRVTREAAGVHFYMASPECLVRDGSVELSKLHLAVNVDKYMAGRDKVAMCMKTGTPYRVSELLEMSPLSQRGYSDAPAKLHRVRHFEEMLPLSQRGHNDAPAKVTIVDTNRSFLEPDANGNMIPKSPGLVVPIYDLDAEHPAQAYLAQRGFDPMRLFDQFGICYSYEERKDIYYRKLHCGFKDSPQGRIIFYADVNGINRGWQARILECVVDDLKYFYQPYANEWTAMEHPVDGKWKPLDIYKGWDPAKYLTGLGTKRNQCLMGYDAAVASKAKDSRGRRYCVLCEGPLDAGRFGPPAMATLGKYVSQDQADLLVGRFERVIYVGDNDAAGKDAKARVSRRFSEIPEIDFQLAELPARFKDAGEMSYDDANNFLAEAIR